MAKKRKTKKNVEERLRKAQAQARNERNKRLAFEEGVKKGIELTREARRDI